MAKKAKPQGRYIARKSHGYTDTHDLCLYTRQSTKILLRSLSEFWGGNDDGQKYLALFLMYNKRSFSFLSIDARMAENGDSALILQASEKVGGAPLYSPKNGKVCASIIVSGNMKEDVAEILPLMEGNIEINFSNKLILPFDSKVKPPLYFECAKYVDQYIKAQRLHWKKFISEERIENKPSSSTQWAKYAFKSYDPKEIFKYPNKKNLLSTNHTEWRELNYVLKMCLDELCAPQTPRVSKRAYKTKVEDLRRKTDFKEIVKPTELKIHTADPMEIKKLKEVGNRIINSITSEYRAWSLDFSRLFECYVQRVFDRLAEKIGARLYSNNKFAISGTRRSWGLSYLEPDILLMKGDRMIVADAKYKMHLYNANAKNSDMLKESFRHDLHQVLAYSSFEKENTKTVILAYPSSHFQCLKQMVSVPFTSSCTYIFLVGIPWGNCLAEDNSMPLSIQTKFAMAVDGLYDNIFKKI